MGRGVVVIALASLAQWGCSGEFLGGAAGGALGTGAAYEVSAKRQLDQLNRDYEGGKMTSQEYQIRKSQVQRGSLIY
ncbi:MAG: hypothetical protein HYZ92_05515 [Candidatus Omnitrophica bacterium]|nr:hypothetical protein [Candidatus Omnitrophota bacterium]